MCREEKKKVRNLIEDIQAVLKDASKSPSEKNNLIYSITESYR
jgi:hypothetical protein